MKILVTGSSGFVGTHLLKKLRIRHQIVTLDLKNGQDIFNKNLLDKKMSGVDAVIHLAAFISASESWKKEERYYKNNTLGTLRVLKSAMKHDVKKFIFFSSAAVKAKPLTPYAVSKMTAEEILRLHEDKINILIIRPENIYGPGQKESYGYVIHNFIKAIKTKKDINIYGNGNQIRDFIYVEDICDAVNKFVATDFTSGTVVEVGTGVGTTINNLAKLVMHVLKHKTHVNYLPNRQEPVKSIANTTNAIKYGLKTNKFVPLVKGINKLVE